MLFAFPAHALVFNQDDHQLCEEYKSAKKVWLQKATEGDVSLQFKLGDLWRLQPKKNGWISSHAVYCSIDHSPEYWLRKAAANGHPGAQFGLAELLLEKLPSEKGQILLPYDQRCEAELEIKHFLTLASNQGHDGAATKLGLVYGGLQTTGTLCVAKGREICAKLIKEQARKGDESAQHLLSTWYQDVGGCVAPDPLKRLVWLNILAINGDTSAANRLNVPILNSGNENIKFDAARLAQECVRTDFEKCNLPK